MVSIPNKKLKLNTSEGIFQDRTCIFLRLNTHQAMNGHNLKKQMVLGIPLRPCKGDLQAVSKSQVNRKGAEYLALEP